MDFSGLVLSSDLRDDRRISLLRDMSLFQSIWLTLYKKNLANIPWPLNALEQWSRQWEYPYAFHHVSQRLGREQRVLDAASGITFFPFYLALNGYRVDACDFDPALLTSYLKVNQLLPAICRVRFSLADLGRLPYRDGAFACIACISVFEHLDVRVRQACLREFHRVLAPSGLLILTLDVDLEDASDGSMGLAYLAGVVDLFVRYFEPIHPIRNGVPAASDLLRTDSYRTRERYRLPWAHPPAGCGLVGRLKHVAKKAIERIPFKSVGVVGFLLQKRPLRGDPLDRAMARTGGT